MCAQENIYIAHGKDPRKIKEELMAEGEEAIEFFSIAAEPIELTSDTDEDLVEESGEPYAAPRDYTCVRFVGERQPVGRCGQCWQS